MRFLLQCFILFLGLVFIISAGSSIAINSEKRHSVSMNAIATTTAESTSAQNGVNLLENILQKMHNVPQIALSKMSPTLAAKPQLIAAQPEPMTGGSQSIAGQDAFAPGRGNFSPGFANYAQEKQIIVEQKGNLPQSLPAPSPAQFLSPPRIMPSAGGGGVLGVPSGNMMEKRQMQVVNQNSESDRVCLKKVPQHSAMVNPRPGFVAFPAPQSVMHKEQAADYRAANKIADSASLLPPAPPSTRDELAMLPPTVITGISLVKLGNSEKDFAKAIAGLGNLQSKKESIRHWSVWSLYKNKSKDCALQVFMRQGVVDAIRIFDSSFLQPDFGIRLGDGLSAVKEKFGEPTFIISDKIAITSQNYIYPLSQAGFQFNRPEKDRPPKIASMIIFSVK